MRKHAVHLKKIGQMKDEILDTNVLLRFLVGDNREQQKFAEEKFSKAREGKLRIIVHPLVIVESCFVLESFYKKSRQDIAASLEVFLSQRWLRVINRKDLLGLWPYYLAGLHFVDSFLLSWAKNNEAALLSFDKKLSSKMK